MKSIYFQYFKEKLMVLIKSLIALMFGVAIISPLTENSVNAHGGRTNASGCHNDRKSGGYHCHNSGTTPSTPYIPPTTVCRTISKSSSLVNLLKEGDSNFKSGEIRDFKKIESKLKGNLGVLTSYTVDGFSVKKFDHKNSNISAFFSFGNNKQWVSITKVEETSYGGYRFFVSDNSFGINKVVIQQSQESRQVCN
jgi:hypothetical protein